MFTPVVRATAFALSSLPKTPACLRLYHQKPAKEPKQAEKLHNPPQKAADSWRDAFPDALERYLEAFEFRRLPLLRKISECYGQLRDLQKRRALTADKGPALKIRSQAVKSYLSTTSQNAQALAATLRKANVAALEHHLRRTKEAVNMAVLHDAEPNEASLSPRTLQLRAARLRTEIALAQSGRVMTKWYRKMDKLDRSFKGQRLYAQAPSHLSGWLSKGRELTSRNPTESVF